MIFAKIQKLSEEDQLSLMRKEVKFKKMVFSELSADFVLFKQNNISASKMYQNLLALHAVNPANQETLLRIYINSQWTKRLRWNWQ